MVITIGDPQPARSPGEQAALKVLYLAVPNLEELRGPNTGPCRTPGGSEPRAAGFPSMSRSRDVRPTWIVNAHRGRVYSPMPSSHKTRPSVR